MWEYSSSKGEKGKLEMKNLFALPCVFMVVLVPTWLSASTVTTVDNVLWYQQPAGYSINEALPVGNGKLGGLVDGAPIVERVVLNESSLWTGDEKTATGGYDQTVFRGREM